MKSRFQQVMLTAILILGVVCYWRYVSARRSAAPIGDRNYSADLAVRGIPPSLQMGRIESTGYARGEFLLENLGSQIARIASVEPTCPCIKASPVPISIEPGHRSRLQITFDPSLEPDFRGPLRIGLVGHDAAGLEVFRTEVEVEVITAGQVHGEEPSDTRARTAGVVAR